MWRDVVGCHVLPQIRDAVAWASSGQHMSPSSWHPPAPPTTCACAPVRGKAPAGTRVVTGQARVKAVARPTRLAADPPRFARLTARLSLYSADFCPKSPRMLWFSLTLAGFCPVLRGQVSPQGWLRPKQLHKPLCCSKPINRSGEGSFRDKTHSSSLPFSLLERSLSSPCVGVCRC
jgi:hypothetical protein